MRIAILSGGALCAAVFGMLPLRAGESGAGLVDAVECRERGGLANFFGKLTGGGEIRIGYLGGSITAQTGWRPKTLKWFQEKFPKAKLAEINAAIGGTGSDLGVFRVKGDVLDQKPDLLFIEFAVNDGGAAPEQIHRCMEGIVRQTWKADANTDICFVYTVAQNMLPDLQAGEFPRSASAMEAVADHYAIPTIHMGLEAVRMEKEGKLTFKAPKPKTDAERAAVEGKVLFSPDGVHPYEDSGHGLYLEAVARSMEKIAKTGKPGAHRVAGPLRADNWEAATLAPLDRTLMTGEWQRLDSVTDPVAKRFSNRMPVLWKASKPGEGVKIRFKGTAVGIYDIVGPDCGQVSVAVDDQPAKQLPRFDSYCTYHRLQKFMAASDLPEGVHTLRIVLTGDPLDKAAILATRKEKIDDPKRFEGMNWYAGAILLVGELAQVLGGDRP